jgi:hypothetical protein
MVVLDIGGDVGALVVSAPAHLAGAEIEICPTGTRDQVPDEGAGWWHGTWRSHHDPGRTHQHAHAPAWPHVAVLARPTANGTHHSAVYPGLRSGTYDLWLRPDQPTALTITVRGAEVTSTAWPTKQPPDH